MHPTTELRYRSSGTRLLFRSMMLWGCASLQDFDDARAERIEIGRVAAGHDITVYDGRFIDPFGASVYHVFLDRLIGRRT